jgi:uncharacterized damage-inducible protein DinB
VADELIDTWRIAARIAMYVLDAVDRAALADRGATKGRSVGELFAHVHNVRLMWLQATAPALHAAQVKLEKEQAGDVAVLRASLTQSAEAIASMLAQAIPAGKVKGFKPHPCAFVGYLIAHESYHIGEIGVALQQSGHPLDKKTAFGIWAWGVR